MPRKLLQWLGALFVLGLLGASVMLLTIVKDRVRIVIAADEVAAGPDPVALMRDDLATVARDVGELRTALGSNLEKLGNALEERADARHVDVQAAARDVALLRSELQRAGARLTAIEGSLANLAQRPAASATANEPIAKPQSVPSTPVDPLPVEPQPQQAKPADPAPAKPKGGFLSFSVPSTAFRFDAMQDFVLVPDLCRVGFDAKSTLHDFSGVTSKVTGRFAADLDDAAGAWTGEVACDAGTLLTGVEGRDTNMYEYLDTKNHPRIEFAITKFVPAANGIDATKQTVRGEIRGTMTIRGVARELVMPITCEVDPSKRLVVKGQVPLKLSDYGVPVPSQLGVINMQDEVNVWIALRARVQGGKK